MAKIDNGGSAFPAPPNKIPGYHENQGMTLRDYFAVHALTGFCQRSWGHLDNDTAIIRQWAITAYRIADEMLTERQKGQSDE